MTFATTMNYFGRLYDIDDHHKAFFYRSNDIGNLCNSFKDQKILAITINVCTHHMTLTITTTYFYISGDMGDHHKTCFYRSGNISDNHGMAPHIR